MISESSHRDLRDDWAHIALPSKTRNRSWPLVSREGEGGRGMLGGDTKRGQAVVSPVSCMYDKCMDVCIHVSMYRGAVPRIPQTQDSYRLWRLVGLAGTKYAFPLAKLWRHRVLLIPLRYARSKSGRLIYHIRVKYFTVGVLLFLITMVVRTVVNAWSISNLLLFLSHRRQCKIQRMF